MFHLEDTTASCSAADDAAFEVGPLVPTIMGVGHIMDLQADIEVLTLSPMPLDGSDEAESLSYIFDTSHSRGRWSRRTQ